MLFLGCAGSCSRNLPLHDTVMDVIAPVVIPRCRSNASLGLVCNPPFFSSLHMPTTIVVFLPPSRSNPFDARNEYCQFHDYAGPFVTILNYANNDTFYDYILFSIFRKNVIRNRLRLSPETLYCAVSVKYFFW